LVKQRKCFKYLYVGISHFFRILFHKIHDILLPNIKMKFSDEDKNFFEKCKFFSDVQVSAEQFGADENYSIPLCAAVNVHLQINLFNNT
jgi:hypothetical protein